MRREALDRKRPCDTHLLPVFPRLVVKGLLLRVLGDRRVDLLAVHPFADVGILGDRLQSYA